VLDNNRERKQPEQVQEEQARQVREEQAQQAQEQEDFTVDIVKVDNEAVLLQSKTY